MDACIQSKSGSCIHQLHDGGAAVCHASRYKYSRFHCGCHLSDGRGIDFPSAWKTLQWWEPVTQTETSTHTHTHIHRWVNHLYLDTLWGEIETFTDTLMSGKLRVSSSRLPCITCSPTNASVFSARFRTSVLLWLGVPAPYSRKSAPSHLFFFSFLVSLKSFSRW